MKERVMCLHHADIVAISFWTFSFQAYLLEICIDLKKLGEWMADQERVIPQNFRRWKPYFLSGNLCHVFLVAPTRRRTTTG